MSLALNLPPLPPETPRPPIRHVAPAPAHPQTGNLQGRQVHQPAARHLDCPINSAKIAYAIVGLFGCAAFGASYGRPDSSFFTNIDFTRVLLGVSAIGGLSACISFHCLQRLLPWRSVEETLDDLHNGLDTAAAAGNRLHDVVVQQDQATTHLEKQLAERKAVNEALDRVLNMLVRNQDVIAGNQSLEKKIAIFKTLAENFITQNAHLSATNQALQSNLQQLQALLEASNINLTSSQNEVTLLKNHIAQLSAIKDALTQELTALKTAPAIWYNANHALDNQAKTLATHTNAFDTAAQQVGNSVESLKDYVRRCEENIRHLKQEKADLQAALKICQGFATELRKEFIADEITSGSIPATEDLHARFEELRLLVTTRMQELILERQEAMDQNLKLQNTLTALDAREEAAKIPLEALKSMSEALHEDIKRLQEEKDALVRALEMLIQEENRLIISAGLSPPHSARLPSTPHATPMGAQQHSNLTGAM